MKQAKETVAKEEILPDTPEQPQVDPTVQKWLDDPSNKWYHDNPVAQGAMNSAVNHFLQDKYGDTPPDDYSEAIAEAEKQVRQYMPELFGNPRKSEASVGEPSRTASPKKGGSKPKYSVHDLSDEQRSIARTYEREGIMTMDEYVSQLAEIGGIE
jgi:hypothetical protein